MDTRCHQWSQSGTAVLRDRATMIIIIISAISQHLSVDLIVSLSYFT